MLDNFRFAPEALVLDAKGNKIGKMSIGEAKVLAEKQGLDLVEVARQEGVSVCKIMDQGKWKYEQKKRDKKNHVHSSPQKEMKFRMRIDAHDQKTKINKIKGFLKKGSDVRIIVEMRGREKANPSAAFEKLNTILTFFGEIGHEPVRKTPVNVSTTIHPVKGNHAAEETNDRNGQEDGRKNGRKDDQPGREKGLQDQDSPDGRRQSGSAHLSPHQEPIQNPLRALL